MTQVLELKFDTANGKSMTLTVDNPKENLTGDEVENAMQEIISSNIFHNNGASLVAINQARIVERTVSEFEFTEGN
ncbi:DUF2922 domain-containing protein [Ureibacillus chungkukjangi]|uniref:DUF2922 family protein n=1 Tax=Ureibacillus chungkukjangi TaxID=1202712 RepID=A0A318U5Z9_9BACL|nr:DUF2922 domain-containing protein [Ureibacillus chungkukjangi]MCM3388394.1 DUF2922 domain-containing protein [Ureibacillus chungkukjangi]PYF07359.1 hypothetical protein BJ095_105149 [Ureibacillus chungkukjangi]